jgi:hypothetical protein
MQPCNLHPVPGTRYPEPGTLNSTLDYIIQPDDRNTLLYLILMEPISVPGIPWIGIPGTGWTAAEAWADESLLGQKMTV